MEFELKMQLLLLGITSITFLFAFLIFLIHSEMNPIPVRSSENLNPVRTVSPVLKEEKNNFDNEDIDDFFERIHLFNKIY